MVIAIVVIVSYRMGQEKELAAHQQLRLTEVEHERKMKELEIEKAKLDLEKTRATKESSTGFTGSPRQSR